MEKPQQPMDAVTNENGVEITDEFFPVTIVETVGEYNAETDTISVCIKAHRDPNNLFARPLSELPAEMREAAKRNGFKFWAKAEFTVDPEQAGNESLKLSDMEPVGDGFGGPAHE